MSRIAMGGDVSKGYLDVEFVNDSGTVLKEYCGTYDDTAEGHRRLAEKILLLKQKDADAGLIVGLESSGGLERNWMKFFRDLKASCPMEVLQLNPYAVKKFWERNLRRTRTDEISARNIAEYLLAGRRRQDIEYEPELVGARTLYRCITSAIGRRVQIQTQLQNLLPAVNPELVQFCRDELPEWILELLIAYPTASHLARARVKTLSKMKCITTDRAVQLVAAAKQTVASLCDEQTAQAVIYMARQIQQDNREIEQLQNRLIASLKDDRAVKLMDSIKGIGPWTAVVLRLEYGRFERFHSADAAVAYAGLDPRIDQSGDTERHCGISRAGRIRIRSALYMPTLAAIRFNPVIRMFYERLVAAGKPEKLAVIACMRKIIHIAYACCVTDRFFDPHYEENAKQNRQQRQSQKSTMLSAKEIIASLVAPVSRTEANRRKAAAVPQNGDPRLISGPGAALKSILNKKPVKATKGR